MAIGLLPATAQLGRAQEGTTAATAGIGRLTERDERLRDRFRELLLRERTRDLAAGWQLAADIGQPAAPLLWRLFDLEKSDVTNRLVLLAAAVIAAGVGEDKPLFEWLDQDQKKPMLRERTLAAMLVAMGPQRRRPVPNFWPRFLGSSKNLEQLLAVAVRLAAVRMPGSEDGAPVMTDDDMGLAAATAWVGLAVPATIAQKAWNMHAPERHAELFWRGALLGAARRVGTGPVPEIMLERSRELTLRMPGESMAAARGTATWLRALAGDLRADEPRFPVPQLRIAAGNLPTAALLANWLAAEPQPRDREEPQRLAVAYALSRPPRVVVDERALWAGDATIQRHIAVALAWQLLGSEGNNFVVDAVVPGLPEWNFVRAAAGAAIDRDAVCKDAKLQSALQLLAEGRLERAALRDVLEETLWRWGSHPRCATWEMERLLIRDVLLAGSDQGGAKYQPHVRPDQRYCPTGLDRDDGFFTIAVAAFEFLQRPRAPIPPEHRLPP